MHIILPEFRGALMYYHLPPLKGGFFMSKLLEQLIGSSALESLQSKVTNAGGRIIDGQLPSRYSQSLLGDFSERALVEPQSIEKLLPPDSTTALGGWCILRKADSLLLREGKLSDPEKGETIPLQSVKQLTNWIERAVSLDQIVGSIGIFSGTNYVAISEDYLWSTRIKAMAERIISIEPNDIITIRQAITKSQLIRFEMTLRYMQYLKGEQVRLVSVVDEDILSDLEEAKKQMLATAGTSVEELEQRYPNESGIDNYSLVWAQYTGPYVDALRKRAFVKTPNALLLEPADHAYSETQAKAELTRRYFSKPSNRYLAEGGPNSNLGFIPYVESMEPNGKATKTVLPIGSVLNIQNYKTFLAEIRSSDSIKKTTLSDNMAFILGVNLLPFGKTKELLLQMIQLKNAMKSEKEQLSQIGDKVTRQQRANSIKIFYENQIQALGIQVLESVETMVRNICEEI